MAISTKEFEQWGFRWPTIFTTQLPNDPTITITIKPTGYLKSREPQATTDRQRKFLREYLVSYSNDQKCTVLNEYEVEQRLGEISDAPEA
jgi:hypothetical protein